MFAMFAARQLSVTGHTSYPAAGGCWENSKGVNECSRQFSQYSEEIIVDKLSVKIVFREISWVPLENSRHLNMTDT